MEKERDLIYYIQCGVITDYWKNGKKGDIIDINNNYVFRFRKYKQSNIPLLYNKNESKLPIIARGFIAYYIKNYGYKSPRDCFQEYYLYKLQLYKNESYKRLNESDGDLIAHKYRIDFFINKHLKEETKSMELSKKLLYFLGDWTVFHVARDYLKYIEANKHIINAIKKYPIDFVKRKNKYIDFRKAIYYLKYGYVISCNESDWYCRFLILYNKRVYDVKFNFKGQNNINYIKNNKFIDICDLRFTEWNEIKLNNVEILSNNWWLLDYKINEI